MKQRIIAFFLLLILAGCSLPGQNQKDAPLEEGELIIHESTAQVRFAVDAADSMIPTVTSSRAMAEVMELVYEPLFSFDEKLNAVPVLAEGWSMTDNGRQYYVSLKQGVSWHDGTAFNANDVIYTINMIKGGNGLYKSAVENIKEADVVSRSKILITLNHPEANFVGQLGFPVVKRNTPTEPNSEEIPVGTGPYRYAEKKSGNRFSLAANPDWHGGEASEKEILVSIAKDSAAAVSAFLASESDLITSSLLDLKSQSPRGSVTRRDYLSEKLTFLGMNHENELLRLPELRKTIAYLIDKKSLVEKEVYGLGEAADLPVLPGVWFHDEDTVEVEIDDSLLGQLLYDQGWYQKDGYFYKDFGNYEEQLCFSLLVNKDNPEKMNLAKQIAMDLNAAGINTKLRAVGYEQYLGLVREKQFDLFIGENEMPWSMDPSRLVHSAENYFGYQSEAMDEILSRLKKTAGAEEYKAVYGEFCSLFLEDMPFVPLFFRKEALFYDASLSAVGAPNFYRVYNQPENWYFSEKYNLAKEKKEGEKPDGAIGVSGAESENVQ